jgi:hypothetical protein
MQELDPRRSLVRGIAARAAVKNRHRATESIAGLKFSADRFDIDESPLEIPP